MSSKNWSMSSSSFPPESKSPLRAVSRSIKPDRTRLSDETAPFPSLSKNLNTAFSSSIVPGGQIFGVGTRHRPWLAAKSSTQAFICFSSGVPEHGQSNRIMSSRQSVLFFEGKACPIFSDSLATNLALSSVDPELREASCVLSSLLGLSCVEGRRSCLPSFTNLSASCLNSWKSTEFVASVSSLSHALQSVLTCSLVPIGS
mmetsp:Transcript_79632/g.184862  ORF Transcript_79632/g.184862 Transcript_79632/m.184862 type:complete len:201 (-) Transcript_79632:48-650(-)